MIDTILTWPPSWELTLAVGLLIAGACALVAQRLAARRNKRAESLKAALAENGLMQNPNALAVSGGESALIVSGERMAVLDLLELQLVAAYSLGQVEALTIFDDKDHHAVDFRLDLVSGARSRRISTSSMHDFCRLFDYLQRADKRVQFIAE